MSEQRTYDPVRWAKIKALFIVVIAGSLAVALAATWVNRHTDPPGLVPIGEARSVLTETYQRPVSVFDAPHIAIVVVGSPGSSRNWDTIGDGRVSFGREALMAVDRRARHDGELVVWCPTTGRWEHPDGEHTYLRDGTRVSGPDLRHLGNLALELQGTQLLVRPGVRIEAGPMSRAEDWKAVAPRCV